MSNFVKCSIKRTQPTSSGVSKTQQKRKERTRISGCKEITCKCLIDIRRQHQEREAREKRRSRRKKRREVEEDDEDAPEEADDEREEVSYSLFVIKSMIILIKVEILICCSLLNSSSVFSKTFQKLNFFLKIFIGFVELYLSL